MKPVSFLFLFVVLVCTITKGTNSLKCYHCSELTGTDQISCRAPKQKECAKDEDKCIKIKLKTNGTGFVDEETAVNCSTSAKCNGLCKDYRKNHADILECSHECCEADLCNHPYTNPTSAVVVGPTSSTETSANGTSLASSTEPPASTGTSSGNGITTTPGEPRSAEPSSLIQNVKAVVLLLTLMGLILVF